MRCAGFVLTGGASRRMGRDKATIAGPASGRPLAAHIAGLLGAVAAPVVELGPGVSGLPFTADAGEGPLVALAGAEALLGRDGPDAVLVVATDLPRLTAGLLRWLADHPAPGAVVPLDGGVPQPLCGRYRVEDLRLAAGLAARGERRLSAWVEVVGPHLAPAEEWRGPAGDPLALRDADTPQDLISLAGPATGKVSLAGPTAGAAASDGRW